MLSKGVRTGLGAFIVLILTLSCIVPQAGADTSFDIEADSAILVELDTGLILFEKNGDEPLPPASMSKMMTEYLVMEAIAEGHFDWDTVVTVSEYAHFIASLDGTSRVWLAQGEERTVKELYTAMAVYSANDATVALAELVAGSEAQFVAKMNEKASQLGMTQSTFVNSTGLPNSMLGPHVHTGQAGDENAMSARDTAILARALLMDYGEVLDFSSIPVVEPGEQEGYFPVRMINYNWMLPDHPYDKTYRYNGLDGIKTGFTDKAQYCFTGTAERNGMRLISVVMRAASEDSRFVETKKLLDYGFDHFVEHTFFRQGDTVEGWEQLPVVKGKQKEVSLALDRDISLLIHEDEADLYSLDVNLDAETSTEKGELVAPIAAGDQVASVRLVYQGNQSYGSIAGSAEPEAALVSQDDVEKANFVRLALRGVGNFFSGVWSSIFDGIKNWFS